MRAWTSFSAPRARERAWAQKRSGFSRHLFEERGHHRLTIDPAADNTTAIRAYERVGFRAVGIMRRYERGPDGVWRDGLLMDMLQEEFRQTGKSSS